MESRHVLMIGPSGVGKTSLAATAIASGIRHLGEARDRGESSLSLALPAHERARIDAVLAGLAEGPAPAASPTREHEALHLTLSGTSGGLARFLGAKPLAVPVAWHDYQGALVGDLPRLVSEVTPLAQVDAVVVPVDASLLMEAQTPAQETAALAIHQMQLVEELILEWEKCRARSGGGLLVLAPVKCETYFADNGGPGSPEEARRLADAVCNRYLGSVLDIIMAFARDISCLYLPVDTAGAVIDGCQWETEGERRSFSPSWQRLPGAFAPLGGEVVMLAVLQFILRALSQNPSPSLGRSGRRQAEQMAAEMDGLVKAFMASGRYGRAMRIC